MNLFLESKVNQPFGLVVKMGPAAQITRLKARVGSAREAYRYFPNKKLSLKLIVFIVNVAVFYFSKENKDVRKLSNNYKLLKQ